MEFKDLEKKLENIKTPEIEIQSHKQRLKMALLRSGYFNEEKIMNPIMFWAKRLIPAGIALALILAVGFGVIQPKLQIAKAMEIAKKDPQIQQLMKDYGVEIKQVKLQNGKAYVLLSLPEEKLPSELTKGEMKGPGQFFIAYQDPKTGEIIESSGTVAEIDLKAKRVKKLEMVEKMKINITPLTAEEKTRAIEIAKSDPKIQAMIPDLEEREVIVKPIPPYRPKLEERNGEIVAIPEEKEDKRVNVIFKSDKYQDIITVNLTKGTIEGLISYIEGAVSYRYRQRERVSRVRRPVPPSAPEVDTSTPELDKKFKKAVQIAEKDQKIQQLIKGKRFRFKLSEIKKEINRDVEWIDLVLILKESGNVKNYLIRVNLTEGKVESIQPLKPVEIRPQEEPHIRIRPRPIEIPHEKELYGEILKKIAQENDELKQILGDNDYEILDVIKSKPIVEEAETSHTVRIKTITVVLEKESTGKKYWITIDLETNTVKSIKSEETKKSKKTKEFPTCNQGCIERGYTQGTCVDWVTSKSPEDWCAERGSTFIPGRYSDCYEQLMKKTHGEPIEGGSVICCCK